MSTTTIDWSAETKAYHEQGYCVIRRLVSPERLQAVTHRLELAVTRKLNPAIAVQIEPGRENDPPDPANPWKNIRKAAYLIRHDEFFQQFVSDESFVGLARALLDDDIRCLGDEAQLKPPRVGSAHPWHQDQPYYSGLAAHFATIWLALDPATKANGCMQVIPGSHRRGIIGRRSGKAWFEDGELDTREAVHAELESGDALVFHSLTAHGSDRNETAHPRRSFIFRYVDVAGLPAEHWPLLHKHGVILDAPEAHPIFRRP